MSCFLIESDFEFHVLVYFIFYIGRKTNHFSNKKELNQNESSQCSDMDSFPKILHKVAQALKLKSRISHSYQQISCGMQNALFNKLAIFERKKYLVDDGRIVILYLILVEILMNNHLQLQQSLSVEVKLEELIILTSELLKDLIEQEGTPCDSIFNSTSTPTITLPEFLRRLHKYTRFSAECLVIAIIYIDRYNMAMQNFSLNNLNAHKMLLTAVLLAAKFQDDFYYDNKAFEFAGGVNALHLHNLQLQIFQKLEYNLYVSIEDYEELQYKLYQVYGNHQEDES